MMMYLAGIITPNIVYYMHQCTRCLHKTKYGNEIDLKHIVRYLKVTRNKGLILTPDKEKLQLDLSVNVYFVGLFAVEDKHDPVSVKR